MKSFSRIPGDFPISMFAALGFLVLCGGPAAEAAVSPKVFDVSRYGGLDATGTHDSTSALQRAAADANAYANDGGMHDRTATLRIPCGRIAVGGDASHPGAALHIMESGMTIRAEREGCVTIVANRNWRADSADPVRGGGRGNFVSVDGEHSAWKVSNTSVTGFSFEWPSHGPSWHILSFVRTSGVTIQHNSSQYGNFETMNGVSHAVIANNRVENAGRACFGHWGGMSDIRVVDNFCSTVAVVDMQGAHSVGLAYTASNTDRSAASAVGLYALRNEIHVNDNNAGGCINLNGDQHTGDSSNNIIRNNKCYVSGGSRNAHESIDSFCILVMAAGHNNTIDNNYCDKGRFPAPGKGAIVVGPSNLRPVVKGNTINNWAASAKGVIIVSSPGAVVTGNRGTRVTLPFLGQTDASVSVTANSYTNPIPAKRF